MNQSKIEIKEETLVRTDVVKSIMVNVMQVTLHKSCIVNYHLFDSNDRMVKSDNMILEGAEYQLWMSDDYIESFVLLKLGYTKLLI